MSPRDAAKLLAKITHKEVDRNGNVDFIKLYDMLFNAMVETENNPSLTVKQFDKLYIEALKREVGF